MARLYIYSIAGVTVHHKGAIHSVRLVAMYVAILMTHCGARAATNLSLPKMSSARGGRSKRSGWLDDCGADVELQNEKGSSSNTHNAKWLEWSSVVFRHKDVLCLLPLFSRELLQDLGLQVLVPLSLFRLLTPLGS